MRNKSLFPDAVPQRAPEPPSPPISMLGRCAKQASYQNKLFFRTGNCTHPRHRRNIEIGGRGRAITTPLPVDKPLFRTYRYAAVGCVRGHKRSEIKNRLSNDSWGKGPAGAGGRHLD